MAHPLFISALRQLAAKHGVCSHPIAFRRVDLGTRQSEVFDLPCGSTREFKCPACARRAKRLREQQCAQGWHREDEPLPPPESNDDQVVLLEMRATFECLRNEAIALGRWDHVAELDNGIAEVERDLRASGIRGRITPPDDAATDDLAVEPRRTRSTRRRQDAPDLPRRKVEPRTVGPTFTSSAGSIFRPSTFITLTLSSYGRVQPDGSPVDPSTYDYRRHAWDAVHFPALLDRLWQNLRRAVGWNVQYFGAVEPQRRLAPHAHFAVRGAIPRATIRQVIEATYHQVWWPPTNVVRYGEGAPQPVWHDDQSAYVDPTTGEPLPTWQEALDRLGDDPDAEPQHVVRFGTQVHMAGVLGGTAKADRLVRYLSKYLTKSVSECHDLSGPTASDHHRRLWVELRFTPCSDRCANWLRYGVQPKDARNGLTAGFCRSKVHQPDTVGLGGRRVLVSRQWSGKTLADHKYDQGRWVRHLLRVARGADDEIDDDTAAQVDASREGGAPSPIAWSIARPGDPDVPHISRRLLRSISAAVRHRAAIAEAKARERGDAPGDG